MFGLFKQKISPAELGQGFIELGRQVTQDDCLKMLLAVFEPDFDYSQDDINEVLSEHLSKQEFVDVLATYHQCLAHTVCHVKNVSHRYEVVRAATDHFNHERTVSDFDTVFHDLEACYNDLSQFESLNGLSGPLGRYAAANAVTMQLEFFPSMSPVVAALNGIPSRMEGLFASSIGTSLRAFAQISSKFKI